MEAIGAASAILSIATAGIQCSVRLSSFATQIRTAPERITHIAEDVSLNTNILQQVGELIKESAGGQDQQSVISTDGVRPTQAEPGVFNASGLEVIMKLASKCQRIFSTLEDLLQKASRQLSQRSGMSVQVKLSRKERLKWPFLQPEIDTMREELKDAKLTLTLMLGVASVASSKKAAQRPDENPKLNTVIVPCSQEDLTWITRSIAAIRKTQNLNTELEKGSSLSRATSAELNTGKLSDIDAMKAGCNNGETNLEATNNLEPKLNQKAGKPSIFDPIITSKPLVIEPARPASQTFSVHILTPQASIQDNEIRIGHRHHTVNLSTKEVQTQLDAWRSSSASSIWDQLQLLTYKERSALETNGPVFSTSPYMIHRQQLEWIHFGEYQAVINGLEATKARTVTAVMSSTTSATSLLPSPRTFWPDLGESHWNQGTQTGSRPRLKLKTEIQDVHVTPQGDIPSASATPVVLPPESPDREHEEDEEQKEGEEEDADESSTESDEDVENVVQSLLAAYTV
ncbi:hypothetical protein BDV26DRAFT_44468 [Aspergillus bertholletiae]|uniref:Fungal N-terminal domain-containing protein n=1 Tax=Aspergillus bertholletiae TaxID=1226010 RepID=A0A5N7AWX8_9EURO|nr:hypothetical protein BDV26DRAFT_44468 [Aspergillus bertholletiae]